MISPRLKFPLLSLVFAVGAPAMAESAEEARAITPAGRAAPSVAAQRAGSARAVSGKPPLPDPALLDGSTLAAEKKSESGMIGDFEIPGDDTSREGKVGAAQPSSGSAGGTQGKNPPEGTPPNGAGGQGPASSASAGGAADNQAAGSAGGAGAGPENAKAGGKPVAGGGDPGAQAQGVQVAELGGEASVQGAAAGGGEKPKAMAIGDSTMRIEPSATAGVVGGQAQQVAGNTQQHDKGTGSGGKVPGGAGGGNRIEKGRAIPAGL
jgi:hypothetical protein